MGHPVMARWVIFVNGRKAGSIGISYFLGSTTHEAPTAEAAADAARAHWYAKGYEHVHTRGICFLPDDSARDDNVCGWCGATEGFSDQGDGWPRCNVCKGS